MKNSTQLFLKTTIIVLVLSLTTNAFSATITYAVATGDWSAANWSPQAPVTGDDVVIPAGAIVTVTTDLSAIELNSLSVSGSLTILSSAKLTVLQKTSKDPLVNLTGGMIQNDGTLSITQNIASNNNYGLKFSDNASSDNSFTNTGILNIDLSKRAAAQLASCIPFTQNSAGRVSTMKFGGTININVPIQSRIFELLGTGAAVILDGTYSFGSSSDYKDWRFLHMGNPGTVTIASTANISVYANYTNTTNGVICMNTPAAGNSFINNGTFSIYGGSSTVAYGIYMNTQVASAPCTLTNRGVLRVIGTFPKGAVYVAGNSAGVNTINNLTTSSVMSVLHSEPSFAAIKLFSISTPITVNNEGIINLSTTSLNLGTVGVLNNTGTMNYNTATEINSSIGNKINIYSNNKKIYIKNGSTNDIQFELIDLTGKILNKSILKGESSSIINPSLKGIFIVRLTSSSINFAQKISL